MASRRCQTRHLSCQALFSHRRCRMVWFMMFSLRCVFFPTLLNHSSIGTAVSGRSCDTHLSPALTAFTGWLMFSLREVKAPLSLERGAAPRPYYTPLYQKNSPGSQNICVSVLYIRKSKELIEQARSSTGHTSPSPDIVHDIIIWALYGSMWTYPS